MGGWLGRWGSGAAEWVVGRGVVEWWRGGLALEKGKKTTVLAHGLAVQRPAADLRMRLESCLVMVYSINVKPYIKFTYLQKFHKCNKHRCYYPYVGWPAWYRVPELVSELVHWYVSDLLHIVVQYSLYLHWSIIVRIIVSNVKTL